jgi:hypothetical protein
VEGGGADVAGNGITTSCAGRITGGDGTETTSTGAGRGGAEVVVTVAGGAAVTPAGAGFGGGGAGSGVGFGAGGRTATTGGETGGFVTTGFGTSTGTGFGAGGGAALAISEVAGLGGLVTATRGTFVTADFGGVTVVTLGALVTAGFGGLAGGGAAATTLEVAGRGGGASSRSSWFAKATTASASDGRGVSATYSRYFWSAKGRLFKDWWATTARLRSAGANGGGRRSAALKHCAASRGRLRCNSARPRPFNATGLFVSIFNASE